MSTHPTWLGRLPAGSSEGFQACTGVGLRDLRSGVFSFRGCTSLRFRVPRSGCRD